MTDERDENQTQPGVYDDDRLLDCVLGLDEDPALLAAASADPALAARLEAMRAEVAHIGAQVSAAVPEPDESYTDLSGERWRGLGEYFEAPAVPAPRRKRRWWQVVAPIAAVLVIALLVGIVAVDGGLQTGGSSGTSSASSEVAQGTTGGSSAQAFGDDATKDASAERAAAPAPTLRERFADQLDRFAVVVLARAREVTGAVQKFAVLRIFKGQAPRVVELVVDDQPTDVGRLHVLMLDPTAAPEPLLPSESVSESAWPLTSSASPGAQSSLPPTISPEPATSSEPAPIPSLAAGVLPGEQLAVAYTYNGEPTAEWELAPGTDPASVDLIIP